MIDITPLLVAWVSAHALLLSYVVALNVWSRVAGL